MTVQGIHDDDRIVEVDEDDSLNTIAPNKREATPSPMPFSQDSDSDQKPAVQSRRLSSTSPDAMTEPDAYKIKLLCIGDW